jgi:hypothetical protein
VVEGPERQQEPDDHDQVGDPDRFAPGDHAIDGTAGGDVRLTLPPSSLVGVRAEVSQ